MDDDNDSSISFFEDQVCSSICSGRYASYVSQVVAQSNLLRTAEVQRFGISEGYDRRPGNARVHFKVFFGR